MSDHALTIIGLRDASAAFSCGGWICTAPPLDRDSDDRIRTAIERKFHHHVRYLDRKENWGAQAWRAPQPAEGDTVLLSECDRIMDKTDFRTHWFILVKERFGGYSLLVHHGGGQEQHRIDDIHRIHTALSALDSNGRYYNPAHVPDRDPRNGARGTGENG